MNKECFPLHHDFYHNPNGARRPIPHEHDKNDKVRVDCYDFSAGYLEDKFSAGKGIELVKTYDDNYNAIMIISSTRLESGYSAGFGIDKDLLDYSSTISVSGFENYYTKEEMSANYAPYKAWKKTDYDTSLLYYSAKNYYDPTYITVSENSGKWNNPASIDYLPGVSILDTINNNTTRIESLESQSSRWNECYNTLQNNSGRWDETNNDFYEFLNYTYPDFLKNYNKAIDMIYHEFTQAYKLIDTLSGEVKELKEDIKKLKNPNNDNNEEDIND